MPAGISIGHELGVEHHRDVELASPQGAERRDVLDDAHGDIGLGVRRAQLGQRRRHDARRCAGEGAHAQARALDAGERLDLGLGHAQLGEDGLGVAQEDLAGRRQGDAARVAHEQPRVELALEARDLLRDRRLGEGEGGRGIGERAACGDLAEDGQQTRVEHNAHLISQRRQHHWNLSSPTRTILP